jgi:2-polyprenyl-3-methyl-5-hydroxy-6-metoxy-1,4-benzoquinol methylase
MPRPDFSKRSLATEWLDANGASPELPDYLRDLAWLNRIALGPWAITRWLQRAISRAGARQRFSLLDVGCGDGDVLRAIASWARRKGIDAELAGIDVDPNTIAIARERTPTSDIRFQTADVFAFTPARPPDFIISSLLAHHLDDANIVRLLRWMETTARAGWLIYDLQRSAIPYTAIGLMAKLASLHSMVVHDGRISVRRSLTMGEWIECIGAAGLDRPQVRIESFLYRLLVSRVREPI